MSEELLHPTKERVSFASSERETVSLDSKTTRPKDVGTLRLKRFSPLQIKRRLHESQKEFTLSWLDAAGYDIDGSTLPVDIYADDEDECLSLNDSHFRLPTIEEVNEEGERSPH